jgi:predicted nucleotidyltransferase
VPLYHWSTAPEPVQTQVRRLVRDLRGILGENLLGIYLHGSLAMGCFHPERSDIDLVAVVRGGLTVRARRLLAGLLLNLSGEPRPLEIHVLREPDLARWRHPFPYDFHFSEGWRARFEANLSRKDWEAFADTPERVDPDLAAHLTILRDRGLALFGPPVRAVFPVVPASDYTAAILYDYETAKDGIATDPEYGVLNMLRVYWYLLDGRVSSKEEAGRWGQDVLPDADVRSAAGAALAIYRGDSPRPAFEEAMLERFVRFVDGEVRRLVPTAPDDPTAHQAPFGVEDEAAGGQERPVCLRCARPMGFAGVKRFHEGDSLLPRGSWLGLFDQMVVLHMYACPGCGKVEFYLRKAAPVAPAAPEQAPSPDWREEEAGPSAGRTAEPVECLACGHLIPPDADRCEQCGWTWR